MRKYIVCILLLVFGFIPKAQAFTDSCAYLNDQDLATCITLCGYDMPYEETSAAIVYYLSSGELIYNAIYYHGGLFSNGAIVSASKLISDTDDSDLIIDEDLRNAILNEGYCPSNSYIDNNLFHEYCLDDDGEWCLANDANDGSSTSFNDEKGQGILVYEFADRLEDFFDDFEITESDLLSDSYDLEEELISSFQETILYGFGMPSFILNMDAYQEGLATLQTKIDTLRNRLVTNVENDDSLTEEEKESVIETINTKAEENTEALEKAEASLVTLTTGSNGNSFEFDTGDCSSYLGYIDDPDAPAYYLNFAFNLIKYLAIIMLFILTVVEYAKAIPSGKDDAIQRATQNTIKRIVIAVIIFFLPILINFIFDVLDIVSTDPTCGIGG